MICAGCEQELGTIRSHYCGSPIVIPAATPRVEVRPTLDECSNLKESIDKLRGVLERNETAETAMPGGENVLVLKVWYDAVSGLVPAAREMERAQEGTMAAQASTLHWRDVALRRWEKAHAAFKDALGKVPW